MPADSAIKIRPATEAEIDTLKHISRETFLAAFAHQNTEENMRQYLAQNLSKEKLLSELSTASSQFYLAHENEHVIGYLKLNTDTAQTDTRLQGPKSMEVERIYVLPGYYGKTAGKQLLDFAIQQAQEHHKEFIWLGVWEHNHRAIRFYEKNGFIVFAKHTFMLGSDKQTDLLMRHDLLYLPELNR